MTTALPNVVACFGVSTAIGQWVTSGYSLAMGVVVPLTAFLITRFPTKRLYMTGSGCFLIGVLISIFSRNFGFMMLGRVLQACGNGVLMSAAQVIILTIYPAEKKGSMMGTSSVSPQKVADASSFLTSLHTVAGSIGSAVFVGIMTIVGDRSAAAYGDGRGSKGVQR